MEQLSVVIITFNEEKNIGRCIDSVQKVADEIVVVDSFSTDNTVSIAKSKGAVIYQEEFHGYIEQKDRALSYCKNDFVLSLDADECIDLILEGEIIKVKNKFMAEGYSMNRSTWYCGRFIRHGSWYPDVKTRLFNRSIAHWGGINPHDKLVFDRPVKLSHLKGDILHYSYNSLEEHIRQNNKFSTISAEAYFKQGKRSTWFRMIIHPFWAFIHSYFIRLGFLDGFLGFVIAKNVAHLTFMKYYKLYAMYKGIKIVDD